MPNPRGTWRQIARIWSRSDSDDASGAIDDDVRQLLRLVGGVRARLCVPRTSSGEPLELADVRHLDIDENPLDWEDAPTLQTTIALPEPIDVDLVVWRLADAPSFVNADAQRLEIAARGLAPKLCRYARRHGFLHGQTPLDAEERQIVADILNRVARETIAERLGLNAPSLDQRVAVIFEKLGVDSPVELLQLGMGPAHPAPVDDGPAPEPTHADDSALAAASPFLQRARDAARTLLDGEAVTTRRLARQLGVSVRTLQRKLNDADTSFREMLDDIRYRRALELLGDADLPYTEIAHQLGYGHVSSFNRAVQRWRGVAPGDLRRNLQRDD